VAILFSKVKHKALSFLFAFALFTAFPTFFEATNAISSSLLEVKKATKECVCHFLPLLYNRLKSFELLRRWSLLKQLISFYL